MLQRFRIDPAYLNRYYAKVIALLFAACAVLWVVTPPDLASYSLYAPALLLMLTPRFFVILGAFVYAVVVSVTLESADFRLAHLIFIPISLVLALIATSYIHNAAHGNVRPRFLRRFVGEACGLFHLVGFPDWTIVHFIHHRHADDPEWDPHPPAGLTYWQFLEGVKVSIFRVLRKYYVAQFGEGADQRTAWKTLPLFAMATQILKVHFWFLLLGPQVFTFLFMSSIVLKNLHYAFFNWATHVRDPEHPGQMQIINLNASLFFRFANFFSHGLYFHKNHHESPNLFNPGRARQREVTRGVEPQLEV